MVTLRDRSVTFLPVGVLWYQCEGVRVRVCVCVGVRVCVCVCVCSRPPCRRDTRPLRDRLPAGHGDWAGTVAGAINHNKWNTRWLLLYCLEIVRHICVLTTQTLHSDSVARFSGKWSKLTSVTEQWPLCEIIVFFFSRRHNPLWACIYSPLAGFNLLFRGS